MNTPRFERPESFTARAWWLGLVILLAFLLTMFIRTINVPWVEEDTYNGAIWAQAAHNNLRAGLLATAGVPATLYFGPLPIPPAEFYVHHPTLLPLLVTGVFAAFGEQEWVARLVPIFCSLASLTFLWLMVAHAIGPRAATLAGAVFAVMPMELHYGDMVNYEPTLFMPLLAVLWCLQRWQVTARRRWAWFAAGGCLLALWIDWPAYLFVLSLSGWLAWKRQTRWLAGLLVGLAAFSGVVFLLQIRWINPAAWSDLWTALVMRVGNGVHTGSGVAAAAGRHFTAAEWLTTVGGYFYANFQPIPLLLAAIGAGIVIARRKAEPGLRWLGGAALPILIAGGLYIVILRNESYIHDFLPYYLLAVIAIFAGIALEAAWLVAGRWPRGISLAARLGLVVLLGALACFGYTQAQEMRSQFLILDGDTPESARLIPALGHRLRTAFAPAATILINFDADDSNLPYYTQRTMLNHFDTAADWSAGRAESGVVGGAIWLGAPAAPQILATLPSAEITRVQVEGIDFALWIPPLASAGAK